MIVDITAWTSPKIPAAAALERILTELNDESIVRSIGKQLNRVIKVTNGLKDIKSDGVRRHMFQIYYLETKNKIQSKEYPKDVESHLLNIISTMFKIKSK